MKQGKVFEKLAARKNVVDITFAATSCTVKLTNGMTKVCNSAHEARLFIEGKEVAGATQTVVPFVAPTPTPVAPVVADEAIANCGTEARTIVLDADWIRIHAGDLVTVPRGVDRVRVTVENAAILLAGCAGPNAF